MKKRVFMIVLVLISLLFLISCSTPSCDPTECVEKSGVFCENNKKINITYACIDDKCTALTNITFDCESLTKKNCLNDSVASVEEYFCINNSCAGTLEIIYCKNHETCLDGVCLVLCGNNVIDAGENCENCPQDVQCKKTEKCLKGLCVPKNYEEKNCICDSDCEDNNPCTVDSCDKQKGKCSNNFIKNLVPSFCCQFDNNCDDGNICTKDICSENKCSHEKIKNCCNRDENCDDNNKCTEDFCIEHKCKHNYKVILNKICCNRDLDCDDLDSCTIDFCAGENLSRKCVHEKIKNCCNYNDDCDDKDPCTRDSCKDKKCNHKPFISNKSYENKGNCSINDTQSIYEHCALDFFSEFFNLEEQFFLCNKKDCLLEDTCKEECSIVKPGGKTEYICKSGKWVKK